MYNNLEMNDDINVIVSHQHDNGANLWATPDNKLQKGAPFSTLESALYLTELGLSLDEPILKNTAKLIFSTLRDDGRFKLSPNSSIYPCHTAQALKVLCYLGYHNDARLKKTIEYFLNTQQLDGGWKCNKYIYGHGPETEYSTPHTTLAVLDALRFTEHKNSPQVNKAINFLLEHWIIKKPISPCQYGIGSLFMKIEYPFRNYNLFYYLYVLSFYDFVKKDERFLDALSKLQEKAINDQIRVERVVLKLAKLNFCKKGEISLLATKRYHEILENLE